MVLMAINNFDVGCWKCWQDFMVLYVTARGVSHLQKLPVSGKWTMYRSYPLCFSDNACRMNLLLFEIYQILSEDHLKLHLSFLQTVQINIALK